MSWLSDVGWCPRHAVVTRADDSPEDCAGMPTLCGLTVPLNAGRYGRSPLGPCRKGERDYPAMAEVWHRLDSTRTTCKRCLEKITRPERS